ncbi:MAG: hypothetical protein H6Q68_1978 [Firmicutes bacterium]|nr:hypothetical protein [Bacillota bacterium]
MHRKTLVMAVCIFFLLSMSCLAEERKEEWQEKAFDFKTVRTVAIQLSVNGDVVVKEIDQKKLDELIEKRILKSSDQRVRFIPYSQLEDSIGKIINIDMGQLRIEDNTKYNDLMLEHTQLVADGILKVNIKALAMTQEFVPASVYTYTTYQINYISVPVYLPRGGVYYNTQAVQVPVQNTGVIPAHNENMGHAGVEFTIVTSKIQQKIWFLLDMQDGKEKIPLEMTERIFQRALDRFRELANNSTR